MAEVDEIHKANDIRVLEDGASIQLQKTGLYDFDLSQDQVRVFKGQALVHEGDRQVKVGGGHEVTLTTVGSLKSRKFHKKQYEDSGLYRFSQLRSDYLAEAATNESQLYASYGNWHGPGWYGPGWYGPGWYWNPWLNGFTFIPTDGVLYSPFGFGFYSPFAFGGPFVIRHHFRDFDDHPGIALRGHPLRDFDDRAGVAHDVAPHPDRDPDFAMGRPPAGAVHAPPVPAARIGGFPRGPAMGAVHPGNFGFHGGGFHGAHFGGAVRR